jgi:hypothetical protein
MQDAPYQRYMATIQEGRDSDSLPASNINLIGPQANSYPDRRKLRNLEYLQQYTLYMAYTPPPGRDETPKAFKKRIYRTLLRMAQTVHGARETTVVQKWPLVNWIRIWQNIHIAWLAE